jgi:glycosyltransferase involved in cell wall biosynthesis
MRIALIPPLWVAVPPKGYGGTELVVANLANGLVRRGHEVTTFACGESHVAGKLVKVIPRPLLEIVGGFDAKAAPSYEFLTFYKLAKYAGKFDIIHNHTGFAPITWAPYLAAPFLTTMHSSAPAVDDAILARTYKDYPYVSVSDAQRRLVPRLNYVATIHNGIDTESFRPRLQGKGNGFLFMGLICRNKGVDIAIETARRLNVPLTIAGRIENMHCPFLTRKFFPHIDGKFIRYVGEVGHARKAELMAQADALLFPSRWSEAFGLVMVEALACGTPVAALGNGSVPEVVRKGVTGLIAKDKASFFQAARDAMALSRRACRQDAEARFGADLMVEKYEKIYEELVRSKREGMK